MTPFADVVCISATDTIAEAAARMCKSPYSRFPIVGDSPHDVRGMVMGRAILEAALETTGSAPILSLATPALSVDRHARSDHLLLNFRDRNVHLAIVKDGQQTLGVATLEDVLEELVGDIRDETDAKLT